MQKTPFEVDQQAAVRQVVEGFGTALQNVSLLGPQVPEEMQANYGAYVAPELLTQWMNNPQGAPGRLTSSPWPERIEISSIEQIGEGAYYHVEGFIIEVTDEGGGIGEAPTEAVRRPIALTVQDTQAGWRITEVIMGAYPGDGDWILSAPNAQGIQFMYPRELPTTYLSAAAPEGWPPQVSLEGGAEYSCAEQDEIMIGDRAYCTAIMSEGAAGSTYRTYEYITAQGDFLVRVIFTLRFPQCLNYDEPQRSACAQEEENFDVNGLADRVAQSIRML